MIKDWEWVVCTIIYAIVFAYFAVPYCDTGYEFLIMAIIAAIIWTILTIILIEKVLLE